MTKPCFLLLSLLFVPACKQADSASANKQGAAPVTNAPIVTAEFSETHVGPFELAKDAHDLAALFPGSTLARVLGGPEDLSDSVTVTRDGALVARVFLDAKNLISQIEMPVNEPYAAFAAKHTGFTCEARRDGSVCTSSRDLHRRFHTNAAGNVDQLEYRVGGREVFLGGDQPAWPSAALPTLTRRCERLVAIASPCGFTYDGEFGWTADPELQRPAAELRADCKPNTDPDSGPLFAQPTYPEPFLASLEVSARRNCSELRENLERVAAFYSPE